MEIQPFLSGDQRKCFGEVPAQLLRSPCAPRIVAGGKNSSRRASRIRFESADIVSLPAVKRDRNPCQLFQRRIGIHSERPVILFCILIVPFNIPLRHRKPPFVWFQKKFSILRPKNLDKKAIL